MKRILPNLRLLGLASENQGQDWYEKSLQIDSSLPHWGMDLAEEKVYLLYDRSPGALLQGEGQSHIFRSVIGPKRSPPTPYILKDLVMGPVHSFELKSSGWPKIFEEAFTHWQDLQRDCREIAPGFMLCLHRQLKTNLELGIQVIFNE